MSTLLGLDASCRSVPSASRTSTCTPTLPGYRVAQAAVPGLRNRRPRQASLLHIHLIELTQCAQRIDESGADHGQNAHAAAALRLRLDAHWDR